MTREEYFTDAEKAEIWQIRLRQVSGSLAVGCLLEFLIGITGSIGFLLKFIGPLTISATITLIGLSLFEVVSDFASTDWWISVLTVVLITLFSQYLKNVPIPFFEVVGPISRPRIKRTSVYLFKLFPVILAIGCVWLLCAILTAAGALTDNPTAYGYNSRTDTRVQVIRDADWVAFPYPGRWGLPSVSLAGALGVMASVLASTVESVGDYYACARMSGAPPPPSHAINRGIAIEGFGSVLAAVWGGLAGTTSYSQNVGAIGITKVGSVRVAQWAGVIMLLFGIFGKFGALFVAMPKPIVGGMFIVMLGMVTAIGISNLQYVDLNSTRNLFIIAVSIFFGLLMPKWVSKNSHVINAGNVVLSQILRVLLSTGMFVGGIIAFALDNTMPGTREERGMASWEAETRAYKSDANFDHSSLSCYDFPFGMDLIRSQRVFSKIPFCPTFGLRRKNERESNFNMVEKTRV